MIEFIIYALTSSEDLEEKYSASGAGVVIAVVAGGFFIICIIGILAAIAIPQFVAYRNKAYQAALKSELHNVLTAEQAYFSDHNTYAASLGALNFTPVNQGVTVEIMSADEACFEAKASNNEWQKSMSIDCNGQIQQN